MGGLFSIVVANHFCALVNGQFEKFVGEFSLASSADVAGDFVPPVCDQKDILQCCVATESAEQVKITFGDSVKPFFRDAVEVDDPGESTPLPVSVKIEFSPEDRETTNGDVLTCWSRNLLSLAGPPDRSSKRHQIPGYRREPPLSHRE